MKLTVRDVKPFYSERHRGGEGLTTFYTCLSPNYPVLDDSIGPEDRISWVGLVEVAPGASIKEHVHGDDEEVYIVISGKGIYTDDGQEVPIEEKDVLILRRGHSHGIRCTGEEALLFYAVVAR